mmetsp:Transcript_39149/g.91596  ORF Transcript_39149/g.91596 Transcript_39149/m.91596 type:complete len:213 (-) Transcript_39149:451-1089(-)
MFAFRLHSGQHFQLCYKLSSVPGCSRPGWLLCCRFVSLVSRLAPWARHRAYAKMRWSRAAVAMTATDAMYHALHQPSRRAHSSRSSTAAQAPMPIHEAVVARDTAVAMCATRAPTQVVGADEKHKPTATTQRPKAATTSCAVPTDLVSCAAEEVEKTELTASTHKPSTLETPTPAARTSVTAWGKATVRPRLTREEMFEGAHARIALWSGRL